MRPASRILCARAALGHSGDGRSGGRDQARVAQARARVPHHRWRPRSHVERGHGLLAGARRSRLRSSEQDGRCACPGGRPGHGVHASGRARPGRARGDRRGGGARPRGGEVERGRAGPACRPTARTRAPTYVWATSARGSAPLGRPTTLFLLDVDNGPQALAHRTNAALYSRSGLRQAWTALRPGGVLAVWSFSDDARFTARLDKEGFEVTVHRVEGSRKGRGRHHVIWVARRP